MMRPPFAWIALGTCLLAGTALAQAAAEPAISLPVVPAPADTTAGTTSATQLPPVPVAATPVALAAPAFAEQPFSYGSAPYSLFFTPNQVANMKRALRTFETIKPNDGGSLPGPAEEITIIEELPPTPVVVEEPNTYPVYYLSSIVYRAPNDWAVWVNNNRITPRQNDGELKVMAVKPNQAWFMWQPDYIQPLGDRITNQNFASDAAVKHRIARPNTASFDQQAGAIRFSLKPNQSFAPGYFQVFEGRVEAPNMKPADPQAAAGTPSGSPAMPPAPMSSQAADAINGLLGPGSAQSPAPAAPVDSDRANMEQMIQNQQSMIPRAPAAAPTPPPGLPTMPPTPTP